MTIYIPAQLAGYRQTAEQRLALKAPLKGARCKEAGQVAATVAARLRNEFGLTRIVVCESLVRESGFT